jgi:hypothetical protein
MYPTNWQGKSPKKVRKRFYSGDVKMKTNQNSSSPFASTKNSSQENSESGSSMGSAIISIQEEKGEDEVPEIYMEKEVGYTIILKFQVRGSQSKESIFKQLKTELLHKIKISKTLI